MSTTNGSAAAKASTTDKVPAPPLVLVANSWLDDLTARTRARPIPWEGYQRADLVSSDELKMIKKVDRQPKAKVDQVIDEDGASYATLYLRLLSKLSRTDTLQQILVLVGDMLDGRDDRVQLFKDGVQSSKSDSDAATDIWPYAPFIKLLDAQDDFVQVKSAQFLTLLIVSPSTSSESAASSISAPAPVLERLLSFLANSISLAGTSTPAPSGGFAEGNGPDIGIQLLEALLRTQEYRKAVWKDDVRRMGEVSEGTSKKDTPGLIAGLVSILRTGLSPSSTSGSLASSGAVTPHDTGAAASASSRANGLLAAASSASGSRTPQGLSGPQTQYQCIFCLWLLTFDDEIASELNTKFAAVPLLGDVARNAVKEKVVRIVAATFRNLLVKAPDANAPPMLGSKILPLSQSLLSRKWTDDEITEDLQIVSDVLSERLKGMSTYDEYASELASGRLTWDNPAHELDDFWRENAGRVATDNGGEQLSELIAILNSDDSSPKVLSIAVHDVGKLVQFHEAAKRRIDESGAKIRILELMGHADADVKYRALATVSKLVSGSWR